MEHVQTKLTPVELVATFPEALPIIKRNLAAWKKYKKEVMPLHDEALDIVMGIIYASDVAGKDEAIEKAKRHFYDKPIQKIEREMARLKHLEDIFEYKGKPNEHTVTPADIDLARSAPIGGILEPNRSGFVRCLFHEERTASCKIFPDNTFRCFGCGKFGDVIDIVQKQTGLPFLDAVRHILKR